MWPYFWKTISYIDKQDNSSQRVLGFNISRFGRLIVHWLIENVNPDITSYRMSLDSSVSVHYILIKPVLSDHLSYVTLFQCSLGRLHKTGLAVPAEGYSCITFHHPINGRQLVILTSRTTALSVCLVLISQDLGGSSFIRWLKIWTLT
jgi:hypothetical protein